MLSELELTILALVAEGPRYGNEVERVIEERGLREWLLVGSSSAYYVLGKLEKQELLKTEAGEAGKLFYELTEAGRGVLQTAIADLLEQPRPLGSGVELGLANLHVLKPVQVYQAIVKRRAAQGQKLLAAEQQWERHQQEGRITDQQQALYTHGIAVMRAEQEWLDLFIDEWRQRYPAVETETTSDEDSKPTQIHRRTAPLNPAKLVQRVQRPKNPE
jgi:DNA-binding PadR family transcriptional regulator